MMVTTLRTDVANEIKRVGEVTFLRAMARSLCRYAKRYAANPESSTWQTMQHLSDALAVALEGAIAYAHQRTVADPICFVEQILRCLSPEYALVAWSMRLDELLHRPELHSYEVSHLNDAIWILLNFFGEVEV